MSTAREDQLEHAFSEGEMTVANLTLRPFSLGTLALCLDLILTTFVTQDREQLQAITEAEKQRQMAAFAWMQSAPEKEVLKLVREKRRNPSSIALDDAIEDFQFTVPVHLLPDLIKEVDRISKLAAAAAVEVVPKDGEKEPGEPGNS